MDDYHSKIERLKQDGYEVKFYHYRMPQPEQWIGDVPEKPQEVKRFILDNSLRYFRRGNNDIDPIEYGGVTECVVSKDDKLVIETMSICSLSDHFNYKRGKQISFGRALKRLEELGQLKDVHTIVINQKVDTVESGSTFIGVSIGSIG